MTNITAEHAIEIINILSKASPEVAEAIRISHKAIVERNEKHEKAKLELAAIAQEDVDLMEQAERIQLVIDQDRAEINKLTGMRLAINKRRAELVRRRKALEENMA